MIRFTYRFLGVVFLMLSPLRSEVSLTHSLEIEKISSPNCNERIHKPTGQHVKEPSILVLHYTACPKDEVIQLFTNKEAQVSSHYFIDKEGKIIEFVPEEQRAWHAGLSSWNGMQDVNSLSIGIELENIGYKWKEEHSDSGVIVTGSPHIWYPFEEKVIQSLIPLLKALIDKYKINPRLIVGHADIAPGRKVDPGVLFPWHLLYLNGIGSWYDLNQPLKKVQLPQKLSVSWVREHLQKFGYKVPTNDEIESPDPEDKIPDSKTRLVIQAFQIHFRPLDVSGDVDLETMQMLASLVDRYVD